MNKVSGGGGIPAELFQILKDDVVKVLHSIYQHFWKTQWWSQNWKMSLFITIPKKGNVKEYSNYHTIALISHASKVILKSLQARLQQYVNWTLPDVQARFRKGRGTRDQITNIHWITEKVFQQNIYFCFIDYTKAFACVDHSKLWKILQEVGIPGHDICLLWNCMQVKKWLLEANMEQWTGSKLVKGICQSCILSPRLFNLYVEYIMRNTRLDEAQAEIKIVGRKISDLT